MGYSMFPRHAVASQSASQPRCNTVLDSCAVWTRRRNAYHHTSTANATTEMCRAIPCLKTSPRMCHHQIVTEIVTPLSESEYSMLRTLRGNKSCHSEDTVEHTRRHPSIVRLQAYSTWERATLQAGRGQWSSSRNTALKWAQLLA
jgi:hypothetical protein